MKIMISGSVAYDYLMTFPGKFKDHILADQIESLSLSFLVESLIRRRGGISPNIAYTMALLGKKAYVFATVGQDFEEYRTWLESKGVDTQYAKVIEDKYTASFFATTDQNNSQLASFYPGAMEDAQTLSLHDLTEEERPELFMISPNDPGAMDKYLAECKELGIPYIYDPSQQIVRTNGETLRYGINGAKALFLNEYEFGMTVKKTGLSKAEILEQVEFMVITLGEKGATIYHDREEFSIDAFPPLNIVDPTGAGDAFRGGFLTGYSRGWGWDICAKMGALTATYCLESDGPQGQDYSIAEYVQRFRSQYDDQGLLDELL